MANLSNRTRKILFSLVAEHIATGLAVGSRTLSRKYVRELSPATIRNVLADLEEAGYLAQPHTSAGRVPTHAALRLFVEAMTEFQPVPQQAQSRIATRIAEIYAQTRDMGQDAREPTGRLLSELAGAAALVAAPPSDSRKLAQLRFIPLTFARPPSQSGARQRQLLAVLVFGDGRVENRFFDVDDVLSETELERIHNLLADVVEGRSLAALRDLFARRLDDQRHELDSLRRQAFDLGSRALADVHGSDDDVVITGQAVLMELPEYADAERLKQLVRALEDRQNLLRLLERTIAANGAVGVYIGDDGSDGGRAELGMVVAPYGDGHGGTGTIGVIGPTRMDYAKLVPLVGATAAAVTAARRSRR